MKLPNSRNRWMSSLAGLALVAAAAPRTVAQAAPAPAPATQEKPKAAPAMTAEQVLDKYVEVTGGKAAYEKLKSRHTKAAMEIKGAPIKPTMEIYEKAPNMMMQHVVIPGMMEQSGGFDGKIGWAKDPMSGVRLLEGKELAAMKNDAGFNKEINWRQMYKEAKVLGVTSVDGKDAYEIELTPQEGNVITGYYDTTSFLMVMMKKVEESPQGKMTVKTMMSDYKEVDGIKIPHTARMMMGPQEMTLKIQSIKHNEEMADSMFAKPASEDDEEKGDGGMGEKKPH